MQSYEYFLAAEILAEVSRGISREAFLKEADSGGNCIIVSLLPHPPSFLPPGAWNEGTMAGALAATLGSAVTLRRVEREERSLGP